MRGWVGAGGGGSGATAASGQRAAGPGGARESPLLIKAKMSCSEHCCLS